VIVIKGVKEYAKCECCDNFATIINAGKLDWDWFTQYLPRTYHYCAKHNNSPDREYMWQQSQIPNNKSVGRGRRGPKNKVDIKP
jgi:hypothetical protein